MATSLLARYRQLTLSHRAEQAVARAVRDSVVVVILPGDPVGKKALRGIPVVGGVSGTCPGTDPLAAALDAEWKRAHPRAEA